MPGFVNRVDIRDSEQHTGYYFRPKTGWITAWGPAFYNQTIFDHEGTRLDTDYDAYLTIAARGRTTMQFAPYEDIHERLRPQDFSFIGLPGVTMDQDYHEHRSGARFQTGYFQKATLGASYFWGSGANFVPEGNESCPQPFKHTSGLQHGCSDANSVAQSLLSRLDTATVTLTFRPIKPLKIDNTYLFERLRAPESEYLFALSQAPSGAVIGRGIFNNHIVRSKWNWQFTPALSLRLILQYNSVLANTPGNTFYPYTYLPTQKQFNADFLLTYLIHPGTAIYVGYNSDLQNLDHEFSPGPEGPAGLYSAKGYINDSRQFFVKVSYLFRF